MSVDWNDVDSDSEIDEKDLQYDPEVEAQRNVHLRKLLDDTLNLREASERGEDCVEQATNILQAADEITKEAKLASTAYLDAQVLHHSSLVYKNCVEMMGTAMSEFSASEFADETLAFVRANEHGDGQSMWSVLEPIALCTINLAPSFCSLGCALDAPTEPQRRIKRTPRSREQAVAQVKKPTNVRNMAQEEGNLEQRLECIMKVIWQLHKKTKKPLEFFHLVINPHSFSETVENIFHMSHLLKEKLITVRVDEQGVVFVKPVKPNRSKSDRGQVTQENQQLAVSINMELWRKFIAKLQLKEPTIPPFECSRST